jgi:hypothetical protein
VYEQFFNWAYSVGKKIEDYQTGRGDDLLKRLIFSIRAEETPGRFLEKLSATLTEYKTNKNIGLDVSMHPELYRAEWFADNFHYLKASILSGFLNAFASEGK